MGEVLAAMIEVADNTSLAMHQNIQLSAETEWCKLMKKARCLNSLTRKLISRVLIVVIAALRAVFRKLLAPAYVGNP
jgi:hypothetical protein